MKNTQAIVLQGVVRVREYDLKPYIVVDDIRFWLNGGLSLRTGDYVHAVGSIKAVNGNDIEVDCHIRFLETIDSRESDQ